MSSTRWIPSSLASSAWPRGTSSIVGQHERRRVKHRAERADPRQVVMAGTEIAQKRIRHVRVEDLDLPPLPLPEEHRQVVREPEAGHVLEQDDRRQRGTGLGLKEHDRRLTALI